MLCAPLRRAAQSASRPCCAAMARGFGALLGRARVPGLRRLTAPPPTAGAVGRGPPNRLPPAVLGTGFSRWQWRLPTIHLLSLERCNRRGTGLRRRTTSLPLYDRRVRSSRRGSRRGPRATFRLGVPPAAPAGPRLGTECQPFHDADG